MQSCIAMVKNNIFPVDDGKAYFDVLPDKLAQNGWQDQMICGAWQRDKCADKGCKGKKVVERNDHPHPKGHITQNKQTTAISTKTLPCISFCILLNLVSDSIPLKHLLFTITISLVTKSCQCQIIGQLTLSNVELE